MTIKSILVLAEGTASGEAALRAAVIVAQRFSAHLEVIHVKAAPGAMVPVVGEGMSGAMVEQMMQAMQRTIETRSAAARSAYDRLCSGLAATWREVVGREPEVVKATGRVTDLIVVSRPDGDAEGPLAATVDAALFDTGRPVLIVPPEPVQEIGDRVVLAWNGSVQAARAVNAARPFLALAQDVTLITGNDEDADTPATTLADYLARSNVGAVTQRFEFEGTSVGSAILLEAQRLQADLLVMGAYGHSRLREMILGGATHEVLARAEIPVLMAH